MAKQDVIRELTDREQELIKPEAVAFLEARQRLNQAAEEFQQAQDRLLRIAALCLGDHDGEVGIDLDRMRFYRAEKEAPPGSAEPPQVPGRTKVG